ncbi:MAG: NUDIX domain-containing protein [Betaproteobacteria bacterium]
MATKISAGILPYRISDRSLEVLLVHPGGPFWAKRDEGAWSIAKGEVDEGEDKLKAAIREFREETGFAVDGEFIALAPVRQSGGKWVHAWAIERDFDVARVASNTFAMEWPPRSGKEQHFAEVDRAQWFPLPEALKRVLGGQRGLLEELRERIANRLAPPPA